ncbi:hypothetical protein GCM10022220_07550 [Actinocatenispora rupis]|uniref:Uncharacterized protein n=1 Tax=Actinocatenispora rupis TaxID=519421 RepID=A0A8J3J1G2_9ACTN|nr:hypothetical protein Aru02nite_11360 [Actinocatenispora rupis]
MWTRRDNTVAPAPETETSDTHRAHTSPTAEPDEASRSAAKRDCKRWRRLATMEPPALRIPFQPNPMRPSGNPAVGHVLPILGWIGLRCGTGCGRPLAFGSLGALAGKVEGELGSVDTTTTKTTC